MLKSVLMLLSVFFIVVCSCAEKVNIESEETAVLALLENYRQGLEALDTAAIQKLYHSEINGFFGRGRYTDRQEYISGTQQWFDTMESLHMSYSDIMVRIAPSGDAAWVSYIEDGSSSNKGEDSTWRIRATVGMEQQNDNWLIVQTHWSQPIASE